LTVINALGGADLDNVSVAASRPFRSISMIEDIIVHPEHLAHVPAKHALGLDRGWNAARMLPSALPRPLSQTIPAR
jgi:hypothetical protein